MSLSVDAQVSLGDFDLDVGLEVASGEVVAVLGPNASGKTTLLRALAGLQPLAAGRVVLDGEVLDEPRRGAWVAPEMRRCGLVLQDRWLFSHLSVLENVAFGPRCRGVSRTVAERGALEWLDRMDLAERAAARPHELSGGQAQRVALARALASEPRLLLLDEPMAALDARTRAEVRRELRRHLGEFEGSCVLVTHDLLDAAALADRLVIVENGRVVQRGTLAELAAAPRSAYAAQLMGLNLLVGVATQTTLALENGTTLQTATTANGDVLAVIAPRDVALYLEAPGGSPRNAWATRVAEVQLAGDRVRVVLDEPLPLIAEITPGALTELGLVEGAPVWASVKATQIDVLGDSES